MLEPSPLGVLPSLVVSSASQGVETCMAGPQEGAPGLPSHVQALALFKSLWEIPQVGSDR